ncbi:solute carrier family 25 (mitochondrial carrier protein), member 16 [Blastomyces parvus]|uniref:Mitochondrial thiamine pyrophosphate carrier 1 n=1 Tax=Blastomyces parvus TaxID=2060905 RepID=A0A2B7X158_9EURO|nr:solute carrier family 25 (mitochondrial carrier protein), member 16 [Blastomyces parvus]
MPEVTTIAISHHKTATKSIPFLPSVLRLAMLRATEVTRGSGIEGSPHSTTTDHETGHLCDRIQTLMQQSHPTSQTHTHTQAHAPSSSSSSPKSSPATTPTTATSQSYISAGDSAPPRHSADRGRATGAESGSPMDVRMEMVQVKESASTLPPAKVCPTDHENIEPLDARVGGKRQRAGADAHGHVAANAEVKVIDKRSLDYILKSGLAGGLAGCAAKTVVGPLDRVKILFQTSNPQFAKYSTGWFGVVNAMKDINSHEGVRGLFRGHSATLLRIFPYAAIKFLAYEQIRAVVIPSRDRETPFRRLISGSMAGLTSVFFTYPLEVMRVRLAFETKHNVRSSLRRICRQIYNENRPGTVSATAAATTTAASTSTSIPPPTPSLPSKPARYGLSNFYRGFSPTLLGMLPYAGVSFLTHDTVGDWLRHPKLAAYTTIPHSDKPPASSPATAPQPYKRVQLTAPAELLSGALAGLVSQTSSYPLEVIRRRMQVAGAVGDGRRMGITETGKRIFAEKGFRGFWVGLTIGYMKVVPMVAVSFFVYERSKWWLGI